MLTFIDYVWFFALMASPALLLAWMDKVTEDTHGE